MRLQTVFFRNGLEIELNFRKDLRELSFVAFIARAYKREKAEKTSFLGLDSALKTIRRERGGIFHCRNGALVRNKFNKK